MERNSMQQSETKNLSFNMDLYPLVQVRRRFSAPVERVWQAWTTPELVKQWWGPENYTCPDAKIDLREGGMSLLAMKGPDGKIQYSGGTYEEIIPNERIVTTDQFTDKDGRMMNANEAGMPGNWPDTMRVTIEFRRQGGNECEIEITHEGIPRDMHDDCVSGWSSSLDKLQRLVERS